MGLGANEMAPDGAEGDTEQLSRGTFWDVFPIDEVHHPTLTDAESSNGSAYIDQAVRPIGAIGPDSRKIAAPSPPSRSTKIVSPIRHSTKQVGTRISNCRVHRRWCCRQKRVDDHVIRIRWPDQHRRESQKLISMASPEALDRGR